MKRMFCKYLIAILLTVITTGSNAQQKAQGPGGTVYVLCYHTFLGTNKYPTDFTQSQLKEQLGMLKSKGFNFISVREFLDSNITGKKNILLTIDDGNETVYRTYLDVIRPMGIKPLFAIYPAIINRKKYALTWAQLKELADDGCVIAAHGYFHEKVNRRLYDLSQKRFFYEIQNSKKVLESKLGKKVTIFVYPFGLRSPVTIEAVKAEGYQCAFTIDGGGVNLPILNNAGMYEIPRYMMTQGNWKSTLNKIFKKTGL